MFLADIRRLLYTSKSALASVIPALEIAPERGKEILAKHQGHRFQSAILDEVTDAVRHWPEFAAEAKLEEIWMDEIRNHHRLNRPDS